ncbi:MAG: transglutaminase family protein [Burkholderiaceae bacterium]|nr:transglutaminase family protein [Burkholderiaceae bacterium]
MPQILNAIRQCHERARLRRVFAQGLDSAVGHVLPLASTGLGPGLAGARWQTGPWFFRDERMYLIPGDSPMGYRLPLDSLPWVAATDYPWIHPADPFAPRGDLPAAAQLRRQPQIDGDAAASSSSASGSPALVGYGAGGPAPLRMAERAAADASDGLSSDADAAMESEASSPHKAGEAGQSAPWGHGAGTAPATGAAEEAAPAQRAALARAQTHFESQLQRLPQRFESAAWITRTALCVEARAGVLYVFMPPLARVEDYLELLGAIEQTAVDCGVKIVLEGYPPPRDARLVHLAVTPDPGVIEVNIHPAHNWKELVAHTEFLYQAAFESRLSAEKFMLDGRHTGTGGGNHFVLGGATPADSPFLRRPDLLASLIAYWHNHPSLSYLFSGLFIGPTSQAPRVDEARNDQLYELEIALGEIRRNRERYGQDMPPWLVDRTLRNVLIDVTGNTHRSEFCIDKLYSPDSSSGRLGLLELRAFEMPPHARMSIVQQLLMRALIARFWHQPYTLPLTRWGTELHDRFLLPTFVQMDFEDVIAELQQAGYAFDLQWFAPHFQFRFPLFGEVAARGIELSVRGALEPWHVMGEEGAIGGTVRYVDSSLERIEVKVTGLNESRYVVTVNGRALPLQSTGRVGEYVAGVRYRAWNPPSALHPTIGVHAPLTFDIVDTWMEKSLGGCQYHVAHPGGRNYDTFPINSYEAESRRLARYFRMGHTPGRMQVAPAQPSREFPFTLDLRR